MGWGLKSTGSRLQLLQTCVKPDHCAAMTSTNTQSTAHTNPAHVFQATGQPGSALARRCRRRSSPGGAVLGGACDVADRKLVRTSASLFDSADDTAKCCSDGTCMRKLCDVLRSPSLGFRRLSGRLIWLSAPGLTGGSGRASRGCDMRDFCSQPPAHECQLLSRVRAWVNSHQRLSAR